MTKVLKVVPLGVCAINGTDWPVVAELSRFWPPGRRAIYTVAEVCKGSAYTARDFRRRAAAEAYAASLSKA